MLRDSSSNDRSLRIPEQDHFGCSARAWLPILERRVGRPCSDCTLLCRFEYGEGTVDSLNYWHRWVPDTDIEDRSVLHILGVVRLPKKELERRSFPASGPLGSVRLRADRTFTAPPHRQSNHRSAPIVRRRRGTRHHHDRTRHTDCT